MTRTLTTSLALIALIGLPACGLQGDLTRADPIYGTPDAREAADLPNRDIESGVSVISEDLDDEDFEDEDARSDDELLGGSD